MLPFLREFLNIALLRSDGSRLPNSGIALAIALVFYLVPVTVYVAATDIAERTSGSMLLALILVGTAAYVVALNAAGRAEYAMRMLAAVFGASAVIGSLDVAYAVTASRLAPGNDALQLARLLLLVWQLVVETHILTGLLRWPRVASALLVLSVFFAQQLMLALAAGAGF